MTDWRLPENRREAFMRAYMVKLKYREHPGCVHSLLPAIAEHYELDTEGRAWLAWINGNTQNPATSMMILDAAPTPAEWRAAVSFWDKHFTKLQWDIDRRHQKSRFDDAMKRYVTLECREARLLDFSWADVWRWARSLPYLGRMSTWSFIEFNRILLGPGVPDAPTLMLEDAKGSRSHRNGLSVVAGGPFNRAPYFTWEDNGAAVDQLEALARDLLAEAQRRSDSHPDCNMLSLESALCTFKSWHKPNRRYVGVYADMAFNRLKAAEARFPGFDFSPLWAARQRDLPRYMRLEDNPRDPGLSPIKQNHYRLTGQIPLLGREYPDMGLSGFDIDVDLGLFPPRKDPA